MKRKTLTAVAVARVRPPSDVRRRRMDWDSVVPGLALRTTATGAKSWCLVSRYAAKVVFVTLGKVPAISLPTARSLAREALERIARGEDPRRGTRPAPESFAATAAEFIEKWSKPRKRTWDEDERMLRVYVTPTLGERPLARIERSEIVDLVERIAAAHGPVQANRVLACLKKLFAWALDRGRLDAHPIARVSPPGVERARDRVLTDAELAALWPAFTTLGYPFGAALQLLLLTACRRGEVEELAWPELDLVAGAWTIPAERMKGRQPFLVPLVPMAVGLLAGVPRLDGCPFVFSTRGTRPIRDWSGAVERATTLSGVTGWSAHDLRRTVRTNMSKLGVPADIAERALGHVLRGVRAVYDRHDFLLEKRDALERWAARLAEIVQADG